MNAARRPPRLPPLLVLPLAGVLAAAVIAAAWTSSNACENSMSCIGGALVALGLSAFGVPLLVWLALMLLRIPHGLRAVAVTHLIGWSLAWAANEVQRARNDFAYEVPLPPLWASLAIGAVAGVLGWVVVAPGPRRLLLRAGPPAVIALAVAATGWQVHQLDVGHRESELAQAAVTAYLPDFGPRATPSSASLRSRDTIVIRYDYDRPDGRYDLPEVHLAPSNDGAGPCAAAREAELYPGLEDMRCREDGASLVAEDEDHRFVGVLRNGTLLVLHADPGSFEDAWVLDALRAARVLTPGELARL